MVTFLRKYSSGITIADLARRSTWALGPMLVMACCFNSGAYASTTPATSTLLIHGTAVLEISGTVTDEAGLPIPGASIRVKGTTTVTQTDVNGKFKINAGKGAVLIFSFIGSESRELTVGNAAVMNVSLKSSTNALNEVVVNGYTAQRRSSVTAAISTISGAEILKAPVTNVTQSLAGNVPGLFVQQGQGRPGYNSANLYIRGRVSPTSTALIIVDGVERSTFSDIDPNEIESISVLKDAGSTALYGLKGANGVFVITTKKGKEGPAKVTLSLNQGVISPTARPEILGAYESAMLHSEGQDNIKQARTFTDAELEIFKSGTGDPLLYPDVDWYSTIVKDHWTQNQQNLTVSGGTEKVKYFTSFGHQFEDGNFKEFSTPLDYSTTPSYNRYNFRARVNFDLSKSTSFEVNLAGRNEHRYGLSGYSEYNDPAGVVSNGVEGLVGRALKLPAWGIPFFPEYTNSTDPAIIALDNTYNHIVNMNLGVNSYNPYSYLIYGGYAFTDTSVGESIFTVNQKLDFVTQGLSLKGQFGYDSNFVTGKLQRGSIGSYELNRNTKALTPYSTSYNDFLGAPAYTRSGYTKTNLQLFLNYARSFGNHNVTANLIGQRELRGATDASAPFANEGVISQLTYNYGNRYLFTASATYNGSENYADDYRYGLFPAITLGYNIANEAFMKNVTWLSMLKIRAAIGKVGIPSPGTGRFYYQDRFGAGSNVPFGNPNSVFNAPTYTQTQFGNPMVSFEESLKKNIGLDIALFKDKLSITADIFDDRRSNILTSRTNTSFVSYGATVPSVNYGVIYNKGYDLSAAYQNNDNPLKYSITGFVNFARNVREVLDEAPGSLLNLRSTGRPIGQYFGYHVLGFYQSQEEINSSPVNRVKNVPSIPGDLKFDDTNGDGEINSNDRIPIGHPNIPEYNYSLKLQAGYKGFQLSVLFNAVDNVSSDLVFYSNGMSQYYAPMRGRWTPEHRDASWPALRPGLTDNPNENLNDFFIQDASYVKLRNVQLSYSFPQRIVKRLKLSNLTLLLSGQNLITWTKFYGVDPENNIVGGTYNYNTTVIPTTKIFNFGLNLSF